jgi:Kef-type K+ transport system membrane component KefB/nucleotide-binding universal stress UspA family protein
MHLDTISLVLLQVVLVIGLSRLVGLGFRRLKQPLVIGEILAGIMLGPSLLGLVAPEFAAQLFPSETIALLAILKDLGLIFFMFLIGLELDPKYLKGNLKTAVLVSHVSILVPFSLGLLLALWLYPLVSTAGVSFTAFALFLGAALSITAFPVLARILTENNLQSTPLGTLALTCAAVDDVTAWCLLALAISVTRTNSMESAVPVVVRSLVYIAFVILAVRPLLGQIAKAYTNTAKLGQSILAMIYCCVLISAVTTELIGIHLIFGAFLIGAVMPKEARLTKELAETTENFVLIVLLPIFFAYSGLRTQIGLLSSVPLWTLCGLVVVVAIAGKYIGTYAAARVSGIDSRQASALGWLMNTRGLTELIVLNIGLSLGVITPLLFTMLVVMALVTTVMTSPLLEWTYPKQLIREQADAMADPTGDSLVNTEAAANPAGYRVLVPVANPNAKTNLIKLATELITPHSQDRIYAMSLLQVDDDYLFESTPLEADRTIQARRQALSALSQDLLPDNQVVSIVEIAKDVAHTTVELTQREHVDLILLGWHRPVFSSNRLGGRVGQILKVAPTNVAVYVDRPEHSGLIQQILLPYMANPHSELGLKIALRLLSRNPERELSILRLKTMKFEANIEQLLEQLPKPIRDRVATPIIQTQEPLAAIVDASVTADLVIAGVSGSWGITRRQRLGGYTDELAALCPAALLITQAKR